MGASGLGAIGVTPFVPGRGSARREGGHRHRLSGWRLGDPVQRCPRSPFHREINELPSALTLPRYHLRHFYRLEIMTFLCEKHGDMPLFRQSAPTYSLKTTLRAKAVIFARIPIRCRITGCQL